MTIFFKNGTVKNFKLDRANRGNELIKEYAKRAKLMAVECEDKCSLVITPNSDGTFTMKHVHY